MEEDSDEHLIRYLLGELPQAEAEQLDERSVTDDALALRLRVLEDDLVDRYARGERLGGSLERFEQIHRASPYLREKVRFAEALHAITPATGGALTRPSRSASPARPLVWALASAAALAIAVSGYLLLANQRLRNEVNRVEARQAAAAQQNARVQPQPDVTPVPNPAPPAPVTATFLLLPPRRGADSEGSTITVPSKTTHVALRLPVESADYLRFWAGVKDVSTERMVWRSPDLTSDPAGADRIVTIVLPATMLRTQLYAIDLSGILDDGTSEPLGEYLVKIVLE